MIRPTSASKQPIRTRARTATSYFSSLPTTQRPSDIQQVSSDAGVVGSPINFDIASKIEGNESQILTVSLQPGEVIRTESGA